MLSEFREILYKLFFFIGFYARLSVVCSSAVLPAQTVAVVDRFAGGAGNSANGIHLFDVRAGNQRLLADVFAGIANWFVCIQADMASVMCSAKFCERRDACAVPRLRPRDAARFPANAACFSGLELALWAFRQAGV
ncbi:hypothetical protein niasHT_036737 [Heterodera trifolii]|uniref:Secreted protein n=1 Tax=Heterodera trifolii TaxID=157864 RepID=A0ABD2HX69_9BILA